MNKIKAISLLLLLNSYDAKSFANLPDIFCQTRTAQTLFVTLSLYEQENIALKEVYTFQEDSKNFIVKLSSKTYPTITRYDENRDIKEWKHQSSNFSFSIQEKFSINLIMGIYKVDIPMGVGHFNFDLNCLKPQFENDLIIDFGEDYLL